MYKAHLSVTGTQPSQRTVAVKTLKGGQICYAHGCVLIWLHATISMGSGVMHCHDTYYAHTHTHTHTHTLSCYIGFFDQNEVDKIMEESVKMKQFNHPNVMSLIGVCIDAGPAPYIIMPFMANGSLLSYLRKERPNLLLSETADDDLVRVCIVFQSMHPIILYSTKNCGSKFHK